ncbi:MAG: acid phosphatase [Gemmatimonadaceae bacterium]|nr:acid phosphatase [Gemmatimonadaceae bacterium]
MSVSCSDNSSAPKAGSINSVNHVVVIYLENRGFDNTYGEFAGATGLADAATALPQIDSSGNPYDSLPQVAGQPYPTNLPNAPFDIALYVPPTVATRDLVHRFYQEQVQIDGGKMDKFVQISDAKGLSMGYYHTAVLPMAAEAAHYTLADHFFHSAFGGSFLNHQYLIAAAAPVFPGAPTSGVAVLDSAGKVVTDGYVTPDGFAVNTAFSVNAPHPSSANPAGLVPNQTNPTIGDRLNAAGKTWAWYSGGWNDAIAGNPAATFQFHHQPFAYYANFADGTQAKADHLKDETDFIAAATAGTLPAVSFVKPLGVNNEHPGYADIITGENHTIDLINAVRNGPNWKDAVIIVTYDENGGFWDHVAPPTIDRWGPGSRTPAIIISPFAKKGFVDKTPYETVSILSFIEKRWNLTPLNDRDRNASPLLNAFDFSLSAN